MNNEQEIIKLITSIWSNTDFYEKSVDEYTTVQCPFHFDETASAGIIVSSGFFNCFSEACLESKREIIVQNQDGTETKEMSGLPWNLFLRVYFQKTLHINNKDKLTKTISLLKVRGNALSDVEVHHQRLLGNKFALQDVRDLGISDKVIIDTKIGYHSGINATLSLPVIVNGWLLGYRHYNKAPKNGSKAFPSKGLLNGWITTLNTNLTLPYLIVCAGEKDMLVARSNGYDAVNITGGEGQLPLNWKDQQFKDKEIWICFDNDKAGINAGIKLGNFLISLNFKVRNITGYFDNPLKEKEDLTDYFVTYGKTTLDLYNLAASTPYHTHTEMSKKIRDIKTTPYRKVPLANASISSNYNSFLSSSVQVKATVSVAKAIPLKYTFTGFVNGGVKDIDYWATFDYLVSKENSEDILGLIQPKDKSDKYKAQELFNKARALYLKDLEDTGRDTEVVIDPTTGLQHEQPTYEYSMGQKIKFKMIIADESSVVSLNIAFVEEFRDNEEDKKEDEIANQNNSYKVYSFEKCLLNSAKYLIKYRPVSNPYEGQDIVLMVEDFEESQASISQFRVIDQVKTDLSKFRSNRNKSVEMVIDEQYGIIKRKRIGHLQKDLWLLNELVFHSQLMFKFKNKDTRGVIYANIIGDTRIGKSEISQELVRLYGLGTFVNAKLSTIDSLVGGTQEIGKTHVIQAGILPKAHKSLVVMEELHGLEGYYKKITEVKSSNKVIINRVSGELRLDCLVRLIEISNPRGKSGKNSKTVAELSCGAEVIKNLIPAPEDIARNDMYLIVTKNEFISNFIATDWTDIEKREYRNRVKWVWSRELEQVEFENESYIDQCAIELNKHFDEPSMVLLGNEASLKIARMAVALAGMTASSRDDGFEKLYVSNEHVSYIYTWIYKVYSSNTMGIDKFVTDLNKYKISNEQDILNLYTIEKRWPQALELLLSQSEIHQDQVLTTIMGKQDDKAEFSNAVMGGNFVRIAEGGIVKMWVPTLKLKETYKKLQINKQKGLIGREIDYNEL